MGPRDLEAGRFDIKAMQMVLLLLYLVLKYFRQCSKLKVDVFTISTAFYTMNSLWSSFKIIKNYYYLREIFIDYDPDLFRQSTYLLKRHYLTIGYFNYRQNVLIVSFYNSARNMGKENNLKSISFIRSKVWCDLYYRLTLEWQSYFLSHLRRRGGIKCPRL